ncbi:hypothetical protein BJ684DRAFT_19028 [Piptocephalis cylindrospora]|uniref:Uncharacterized protein n=1 Tax=Piptocephalis cylindrospora TaxID=1907219 RepID=A0A4P9Y8B8_9FUNG|nr:hypothetical protein BJ684DRAFT_19028 [Piptocephalis cylindrospora]|eukprot:RKP14571.1 hypothetical protein BJ684DRAFT_19028 [Piptocephalis cylindrospora]
MKPADGGERGVLLAQLILPSAYDQDLVQRVFRFLFPESSSTTLGKNILVGRRASMNRAPGPSRANDAFAVVQATSNFLGSLTDDEKDATSYAGEIAQMAMYALERSISHPQSTSRTGLVEVCKLRSNLCTRFIDMGLVQEGLHQLSLQRDHLHLLLSGKSRLSSSSIGHRSSSLATSPWSPLAISISELSEKAIGLLQFPLVVNVKKTTLYSAAERTIATLIVTLMYNSLRILSRTLMDPEMLPNADMEVWLDDKVIQSLLSWLGRLAFLEKARCERLESLLGSLLRTWASKWMIQDYTPRDGPLTLHLLSIRLMTLSEVDNALMDSICHNALKAGKQYEKWSRRHKKACHSVDQGSRTDQCIKDAMTATYALVKSKVSLKSLVSLLEPQLACMVSIYSQALRHHLLPMDEISVSEGTSNDVHLDVPRDGAFGLVHLWKKLYRSCSPCKDARSTKLLVDLLLHRVELAFVHKASYPISSALEDAFSLSYAHDPEGLEAFTFLCSRLSHLVGKVPDGPCDVYAGSCGGLDWVDRTVERIDRVIRRAPCTSSSTTVDPRYRIARLWECLGYGYERRRAFKASLYLLEAFSAKKLDECQRSLLQVTQLSIHQSSAQSPNVLTSSTALAYAHMASASLGKLGWTDQSIMNSEKAMRLWIRILEFLSNSAPKGWLVSE